MRDALRAKMMTMTTTTTSGGGRRADIEEEEEDDDEEKETRNALERALASVSWRRRHATTLREAVENEKRRNDALERRVREREKRARAIAMAKRTPGRRRGKNLFDTTTKVDDRELSRIRLKSCEFEVRCERSRVFRDVKDVFELEAKRIKSSGKTRSIDCYGKVLPDVDAFAYSSKQQQQQQHATHNKGDLDEFIGALFSTNENEDENENEIAAMLSMMNRFVALLGKYSFCPSLHRSTPGVTNATEIWKPVDSTTTTCSSRNFEPDGKESFDDDDDDDYERDEAVKVNEFFRKTFGNEDVVVYGDIATPECEMLLLYYFRADARNSVGEEDGRTKKKRLLRAVRLLQKSCEIVASHLAAEVTELATSDIFEVEDEDEHQYSFSRCLMREMGNTNKATRSGPFCSLLVAFEALIELAERTRLQNLYYYSSSSSASTSCDELFSSEEEQEENDNEGLEPVVVISPSLRNIDNTVTSKTTTTTTTTKKRKSKKSSRKLLAEKSKSMIKSVWGFVAEPTKKLENNSKLTRVLEKNEDEKDENRERDKHHACDDEKDDEDWDVIDVPHTLIRKTSSSNNDSKKKNIRLPPPPCEEENLDHYVRAMFTDKQ